ncbi:hypothetical protein MPTK1_2g04800 [Marchantia polymorpha subsp. ruderalis]|uniref:VOC domain-containing protein n=2 Tax=Marchantia polymorpha TaxID=3197 RepID=A0A176W1J2_MARPO|nr:hypothetical protein AXG93_4324s1220 [Marchantia polymorpha subsp. ruderalis]PTQ42168.1 hypothetical protein MARPO_0031s0135 [Marchantia polymorpha]BBN01119.1 hypothetical protein Mp_2g04800 [Marchantia polymorpha subsp. ruderalis]|eukprot:PTQ42168.1 hypothetical protein MARPO_0031s0135 [Marchantia polymorpha]
MRVEDAAPACGMVGQVNFNKFRKSSALPLTCVNHISRVCSNLTESRRFYENVLGFVQIKRPGSFDFEGAWLFNYGIGIHLLQSENGGSPGAKEIDPKADHVSFQCEDMTLVEEKLQESGIKYLRREVEEGGILVDQLFFHDPDGFMIEVCNCDKLPVVPLARAASITNRQPFFSSCKRSSSIASSLQDMLPMQSGNTIKHSLSAVSLSDQTACPAFGIVIDSC